QQNGFYHPGYDYHLARVRQFLRLKTVYHGHHERQSSSQSYARWHLAFQVLAVLDTFLRYPRNTVPDLKHNPVAEKPVLACSVHQRSWCPNKFLAKECRYPPTV